MTNPPAQQLNTHQAGMWADSTLRPYLRHTYDKCRKYTSISCKDAGIRDINLHYFSAEVMGDTAMSSRGALLALKSQQHMVVTTRYAGSSLLCKFIAMELSAGKVDEHLGVLQDYLPVYIDLAGLDEVLYRPGTVVDQVITELNEHLVEWGRSSFLSRLNSGNSVVVFDNLDHLDFAQQAVALEWIKEVIDSGNKLVVATRDPLRAELNGIPVFEVAGLNMSRIMLMASHWLNGTEKVSGLHKLIGQSTAWQGIVSHPVTLMMALQVYGETSRLPQAEFDLAAEFLTIATKTVKRAAPAKMGVPDYLQRSWLAMIGFNLHKREVAGLPTVASEAELIGWMQDILGDESQNIAATNLSGFLSNTSIFTRTRQGFGFANKSLTTLTAAQHIERYVVTPSFVLSSKARTGISRKEIAAWSREPAWKDVLEGVKSILERDRSKEWLDEFLVAVDGAMSVRSHSDDGMSP